MADLQLVGAVAVKVRPDARDFRREAKNEIMRQLRDLEGEFDVTVDPNIKYNEAAARSQFRNAFKDLVIDQNITIKPNIDDQAFRDAIQKIRDDALGKVPQYTQIRVDGDTTRAQDSLAELNNKIADTEGQISRLPSVLQDMAEANTKAFNKFTADTEKSREALRALESAADQAKTRSIESAANLSAAKAMEAEAIREVGKAEAVAAAARDHFETLALQVMEEKDKARKKELTEQRVLANKFKAEAEARLRSMQAELKEARKILGVTERANAKADEALEKANEKIKAQRRYADDLVKHNEKITAEYEEQKELLEEKLKAGELTIAQAKAERNQLEALNAARAKSFRELEGSIYQGIESWDDYRVRVAKGMTTATNYIEHLRDVHHEAHGQMKADIGEYLLRIEEFGKRRKELAEVEWGLAEDMRQNANTGWMDQWFDEDTLSDFDLHLKRVQEFADDAAAYIERKRPQMEIRVDVDRSTFTSAEGLLDFLARDRNVNYKPTINNQPWYKGGNSDLIIGDLEAEIELKIDPRFKQRVNDLSRDIAKAFSGYGFARRLSSDMKDMLADFDRVAISAGKMGVAVTAAVGASLSAFGGLAAITSDLGELTGALLLVPAAVVGLGSMVYATMKGFDQFKAAVDGDAEALASFNAEGQRAARRLGELSRTAARLSKQAFWNTLGSDMGDMADAVFEPVITGLTRASGEMGKFWGGLFRSLEKFASSGDMDQAFRNMNDGLASMSDAAEPFLDALNIMGLAGSRHLPAIGELAAENAKQFRDWAAAAEESGQMNDWISQAARHLDDLQTITYSTVKTVGALGDAADAAGFGGLRSLARNMIAVSDASQNPFFQGNMANLFQGGLDAVKSMSRGLYDMGVATLEQSAFIQESFESIGRTVGNIFTEIADVMNNDRMLLGIREFLADVEDASNNLGPLMEYIAVGIGDAARLAGELVKAALDIAEAFFRVWTNSDNLVSAMEKLIPYASDLVVSLIEMTHVPIDLITEMVAFLIEGFMALPKPIRDSVAALGLLAAMAPKLMAARTALSMLSGQVRLSNGEIGGFRKTWQTAMTTMSQSGRTFLTTSKMLTAQDRAVAKAAFAWRDFGRVLGGGQSFAQARTNMQGLYKDLDRLEQRQRRTTQMINRSTGIGLDGLTRQFERTASGIAATRSQITEAARSSLAGATTAVRTETGRIVSSFRDMRTQLGSASQAFRAVDFAPLRTALVGVRTTATDAGKALASSAAGSLKAGASSILQAFGGPWVAGFLAAGIAVLDLVSTVKSSQSAFEDFGRNIEDFGSKGEEVASQLEQAFDRDIIPADKWGTQFNNWWDDFEPLRNNLTEAMDDIGMSSKDMSTAVTGSSEEYANALGKLQGAHDKLWNNNSSAIRAMQELRAEFIEQSVASKNSAAAMGLSETGAVKLRGAMGVLMDGTGSTTAEIDAMRTSLDALHGGQLSAMQSSMDLANAEVEAANGLADVKQQVIDSRQSYDDLFRTVKGGGVVLNEQNSNARDLAQTMTEWGDTALSAGKQVYDAAIQSGEGHAQAADKAAAAMDTSKSAMRGLLEEADYSTTQINSLLDTFTGQDWELELTFMGKTDQFLEAKGIVEAGGNEIDGKNFTAFLRANPGTTIEDIRQLAQAGMTWESSRFTSEFGAETADADAKLEATLKRGEEFDNKDFTISLSGDDGPFLDTVLAATAKGEDFNSKEFEARFGANTEVLADKMFEAIQRGEEFGSKEWVASIDAENEGFAEAFLVAEAQAQGLDGKEVTAYVMANIADYSAGLSEAEQLRMNLDGTAAEVSVGANTDQYMLKMRAAELAAQGMDNKEIQAALGLNTEEWNVLTDGTFDNLLNSYRGPHEADMKLNGAGAVKQQAEEATKAVKDGDGASATMNLSLLGEVPVVQGATNAKTAVESNNNARGTGTVALTGDNDVVVRASTAKGAVEGFNLTRGLGTVALQGDQDVKTKAEGAKFSIEALNTTSGTATAKVNGTEEVKTQAAGAKTSVETLNATTGTATAKVNGVETAKAQTGELVTDVQTLDGTNADPQVNLGGSPAQVREDLDHIQRKLDDIGNKNPTATVTVTGASEAQTNLQNVVDKLNGMTGKTATAMVTVVGAIQAQADTDRVVTALNNVNGKTASGTVIVNGAPTAVAQIQSVITNMNTAATTRANPVITVMGSGAAVTQIQSVITAMRTLNGTNANPRVTLLGGPAATSGIAAVQRVLDALGRTTARPRIDLQGHTQAQGEIRTTQSYLNTLSGTTATPNIVLGGAVDANGQINSVRQNLADLNGRSATVTVITRRVGENADGGITTFADGGIIGAFKQLSATMGRAVQAFSKGGFSGYKAFADGGVTAQIYEELAKRPPGYKENHIAQIAKPKTPFRVWAEPETSPGEAYIPLASSKRSRSTRIWEETGNMLGVDWEAYADGGTSGTRTGGGRAPSGRRSGKEINVNINNHYPQAEPTSVTVNRALQLAANL